MSLLSPEVLKALQGEYIKSFKEKSERITKFLEIEDWTGLEREFHKFSGSGTTYKMPEISKIARAIEIFLEKNTPPDAAVIQGAVDLFQKILHAREQGQALDFENEEAYKKIL